MQWNVAGATYPSCSNFVLGATIYAAFCIIG